MPLSFCPVVVEKPQSQIDLGPSIQTDQHAQLPRIPRHRPNRLLRAHRPNRHLALST